MTKEEGEACLKAQTEMWMDSIRRSFFKGFSRLDKTIQYEFQYGIGGEIWDISYEEFINKDGEKAIIVTRIHGRGHTFKPICESERDVYYEVLRHFREHIKEEDKKVEFVCYN